MIMLCFFFFSSRRRHTRCSRDWSSDVCSSDLTSRPGGGQASKQRNFTFRFEARRLRDFFFGPRLHEFPSADGSCPPDLRKEIAVVIALEDQLRLGWCFVCLGSIREHHGGRLCV